MSSNLSQADQIRIFINEKLNAKYDFTMKSKRQAAINEFISQYNSGKPKNQQTDYAKIRPNFTTILDQCLINKGIDPAAIGKKSNKPKFNTDLNTTITPEIQSGNLDESKPKTSTTIIPNQTGQTTASSIPQAPLAPVYDVEAVGSCFSALALTLKSAFPHLKQLTPEQEKSLGKMWLPAFNLYFRDEKMMIIAVPAIATLGIFLPMIAEARQTAKKEAQQKAIPDSNTSSMKEDNGALSNV